MSDVCDCLHDGALHKLWDDPELDATDAAHPAWWRGDDHGVDSMAQIILDLFHNKRGLRENDTFFGGRTCNRAFNAAKVMQTQALILGYLARHSLCRLVTKKHLDPSACEQWTILDSNGFIVTWGPIVHGTFVASKSQIKTLKS